MSTEFVMPKLQPVMEEGTLVCWKKQVGEHVEQGEVLLEVESEKATMEVESTVSGIVQEIMVQAGQTVAVGTPLAIIVQAGEEV